MNHRTSEAPDERNGHAGTGYAEMENNVMWQLMETAPKEETILAWWLNGEQHTGSTDGDNWFPAWEHQGREWSMPQLWMPLTEPDEELAKRAASIAMKFTQTPGA